MMNHDQPESWKNLGRTIVRDPQVDPIWKMRQWVKAPVNSNAPFQHED